MRNFLSKTAKLNRSIISEDFEKTLDIINQRIPLTIHRYPTGTKCFDWVLPKKWIIRDAYIKDDTGKKILDWKKNPLHVVIGSLSINKKISREELLKKIYVSNDYPDLIPYQFKFYELDWGFCMTKKQRDEIKGDSFKIVIDSQYIDDYLLVGEHIIKGTKPQSIILMAHIDHPAMVNDGLAGAAVLIKLAEALRGILPTYTLKFQFLPERIGSIAYLCEHYQKKDEILGGIFCEMPGTPKYPMVLQYSKKKETRLDRIASYVLRKSDEEAVFVDCFKHIKNDDAFYNSPGIDIPCISLSRSKSLEANNLLHCPFYHTSGDNLENFDFAQAEKFLSVLKEIIFILNEDKRVVRRYVGVPHLSRHNLWVDWRLKPKISGNIDTILYSLDNQTSIFDISEKNNLNFKEVHQFIKELEKAGLVELLAI